MDGKNAQVNDKNPKDVVMLSDVELGTVDKNEDEDDHDNYVAK